MSMHRLSIPGQHRGAAGGRIQVVLQYQMKQAEVNMGGSS